MATYTKDVLENGLRVVTVEAPHLHSAMLVAYVRVGSRHEEPRVNGVSHFLEHMFFRGSARYPDPVKMNAAIEDCGGNLNGVTTRDHSYFFTPIDPDHVAVGIDILADMLKSPRLMKMEVERQVILEEMLDEVDERGRDVDVDNLSMMALFKDHPLAMKIAGTRRSVKTITRADLKEHLRAHYGARNMVFVAAGRVARGPIVDACARAFEGLPPGDPVSETPPRDLRGGPTLKLVERDDAQTEFRLAFRSVPEGHPDHPALALLRRVLDDGLSSRLPFNVIEKRGLAYSLNLSMEVFSDAGFLDVEGASAPSKAAAVIEQVFKTLGELSRRRVREEELARAKRRHRTHLTFSLDSCGELAGWFGGTELFRPPESFEERCALFERQTTEDLLRVARTYLTAGNLCAVAVGPRRGYAALERAVLRAAALPR